MSEPTTPAEQPVTFSDGKTIFHVLLTQNGTLRVTLIGRSNGRLIVLPESNTSLSLFSSKRTGANLDNR